MCVHGTGFDLLAKKVYRVVDDPRAAKLGCLRVIDESGEDYLYPADWFILVRSDKDAEAHLTAARTLHSVR